MNNKFSTILLVILTGVLFYLYNEKIKLVKLPEMPFIGGETFVVKKVRVISGHEFEITYNSGSSVKSIHALLQIKSKALAKEKVIKFLNESNQPRLIVYNKLNDIWIVDLVVYNGQSTISLAEWLKKQDLILE